MCSWRRWWWLSLAVLVGALPGRAGVGGVGAGAGARASAGPELVPAGAGAGVAGAAGLVGQDVDLRCTVLRLGDKSVSWVRSRDLQILSHAGVVFTADTRVSAASRAAGPAASVHSLRIARLRPDDAGRYECQLNTEPKTSLLFELTVLERVAPAPVVSAGAAVVRAARGGTATLRCEARYEPAGGPPLQIRWSREGEALEARGSRGGVSLEAERWTGGARSALTLAGVRAEDAGVYECGAGGESALSRLEVLEPGAAAALAGAVGAAEAMQGDAAPETAAGGSGPGRGCARVWGLVAGCAVLVGRGRGP